MDVAKVARAVLYMANLPLDANVATMTLMATKMPFIGSSAEVEHMTKKIDSLSAHGRTTAPLSGFLTRLSRLSKTLQSHIDHSPETVTARDILYRSYSGIRRYSFLLASFSRDVEHASDTKPGVQPMSLEICPKL